MISNRIITYPLEKGQTREDFKKEEIVRRFHNINIGKGFISGMKSLSRQSDILILNPNAQRRALGQNFVSPVKDVIMVIEVKSNASGSDIKKFSDDIEIIKQQNPDSVLPKFGMFCYRVSLKRKTLYQRFGYQYDEVNDLIVFDQDAVLTAKSDYSGLNLTYSNFDFFLSMRPENDAFYR